MEKKKKKKDETADRISNLSDSILHHIFSFLNMEEAVRSSVLSNRWRHLWASLPTLNFKHIGADIVRLKRFVDKVFILRDGSDIQRFAFTCQNPMFVSGYVNDWIISALRHNVEELDIDMCFDYQFQLPNCLFNSKSLTILKLVSWGNILRLNNIPVSMCLPNLKTMFLDTMKFGDDDDDQTSRFFSSCPVLESLTIANSMFHHTNLKISSLSLKHLKIEIDDSDSGEFIGPIDGSVKLCTPNLISFHCIDYMEKNYALENLSSLFKACISLTYYDDELSSHSLEVKKNMYGQRMLKFLGALHNVTELTLSASILEVVSGPALLESNPIYRNLRSLKMNAWLSGDCIRTIICLLKMSPAIETLFVRITQINFNSPMIEENWEAGLSSGLSSECLLNHLKRVGIQEAKGSVNELKFLETLLKNAVVLETLIIVFASTEVSVTDRATRLVKFGEKLRAFPKASSSITMMLI